MSHIPCWCSDFPQWLQMVGDSCNWYFTMMFHELSGVWGISGWLKENYRSLTSPLPPLFKSESCITVLVLWYPKESITRLWIPCTQRYWRSFAWPPCSSYMQFASPSWIRTPSPQKEIRDNNKKSNNKNDRNGQKTRSESQWWQRRYLPYLPYLTSRRSY